MFSFCSSNTVEENKPHKKAQSTKIPSSAIHKRNGNNYNRVQKQTMAFSITGKKNSNYTQL